MNETINNKISSKPLVILTRKLPEIIETRMRELFDARLNDNDTPFSLKQLKTAMNEAEVLVPTVTDKINAEVINAAGSTTTPFPITLVGCSYNTPEGIRWSL